MGKRINPIGYRLKTNVKWELAVPTPRIEHYFLKKGIEKIITFYTKKIKGEALHINTFDGLILYRTHIFLKKKIRQKKNKTRIFKKIVEPKVQKTMNKHKKGDTILNFKVLGSKNSKNFIAFKYYLTQRLKEEVGLNIILTIHNLKNWIKASPLQWKAYKIMFKKLKRNRMLTRYKRDKYLQSTLINIQTSIYLCKPKILLEVLARALVLNKKHWAVINFFKRLLKFFFFTSTLKGLQIRISGKINGKMRKKKHIFKLGNMPLQSIDDKIGYAYKQAVTKFGVLGLKIWYRS